MMKSGPMIGHSSRLPYDRCAYPDKLQESTDPVSYRLNKDYIHNCNRCLNSNGAGPRTTTLGFGDSTVYNVGHAPANDLVDVDSICRNLNVKTSKCKRGHINPVNLTKVKSENYSLCGNYTHPEFTRLSHPPSNYRDMSVNRFYNLHHDPQETIFWDMQHNTRLEAKDNWIVEIPEMWEERVSPAEYKGKPVKCGMTCDQN
jgi:hypothetical protein